MKDVQLRFSEERMVPNINKGSMMYYEHFVRYLFACQFAQNKTVLDLGCGAGYGSLLLSEQGKAKKVIGIDESKETIRYAQQLYSRPNITFHTGDIMSLENKKGKSVDIITAFEVIEHLLDQESFVEQAKKLLKNDGIFIISTPNKYTYPKGNPYHKKELYPQEFTSLLKKFYKNITVQHQFCEFSHIIKTVRRNVIPIVNDNFIQDISSLYTSTVDRKMSQYLVAVCSNGTIPKVNMVAVNSTGVSTLNAQFQKLQNKNKLLEDRLFEITLSKFYKIWPIYKFFRDLYRNCK